MNSAIIDKLGRTNRSLQIVATLGVLLLLSQSLMATGETIPTKDISFECSVEPTPELGKEFTVSATFWFNEKIYYPDNPYSQAKAKLSGLRRQQYVSGDTLMSGKFEEGERHTLSATYRAIHGGDLRIGVKVYTDGLVDSIGKPVPDSYTRTTHRCGSYYLGEKPPSVRTVLVDSATGLTISTAIGTGDFLHTPLETLRVESPVMVFDKSRIPKPVIVVRDSNWLHKSPRPAPNPRKPRTPSTDTNYINLDVRSLSTSDTITLLWPAVNILVFSDAREISLDANKLFITMRVDSSSFHIMPIRKPSTITIKTSKGEITLPVRYTEPK